jgi:S-adenosylmethionine uptake transporter
MKPVSVRAAFMKWLRMSTETDTTAIRLDVASANMRGLVFLAIGFFLFASCDTIGKFLTREFHPVQIVWFRQLGLMVGAFFLLAIHGPSLFRTASPVLQFVRGGLIVLSAVCFVFAIRHVPLADAVAVSFVAPFLVTIMSVIFLREKVGIRRWSAIVLGFIGAMIVIRPGLGVFHPAIFFVLAAATFFAMRQVLSRMLAGSDRTLTTIIYTAIVSMVILSIMVPFVWQSPSFGTTWLLVAAMAALAAGGEIMVIRALEVAEAAVVAPVHYSLILWATFYGWLVFGQLPDFWTWVGTGVIFATGLYLLNRERVVKAQARRAVEAERSRSRS